jgi:hypothetical protein
VKPEIEPALLTALKELVLEDANGAALWTLLVEAERQAMLAEPLDVPTGLPTPFYQRGLVTIYHGDGAAIGLQLAAAGVRGFVAFDPAYSPHVHASARSLGKRHGVVGSKAGGSLTSPANKRRKMEIGFDPLWPRDRRSLARAAVALAARWIATFADTEGTWLWRLSLAAAGAEYVREGSWRKLCSTPQVSGDRPAVSREAILLHHARGARGKPKAKRWNGGGLPADWAIPIVLDRGSPDGEERVHTTQKPEELMVRLLELFIDREDTDEPVIDLTAGSGTTGIGAVRNGRRCILVEREETYCRAMAARFDAESDGVAARAASRGQLGLFAAASRRATKSETPAGGAVGVSEREVVS